VLHIAGTTLAIMDTLHNFQLLSATLTVVHMTSISVTVISVQFNLDDCHCPHRDDIIITCHDGSYYNQYGDYGTYVFDDPTSDSSSSPSGAVVGAVIGGSLVCGVVILLVICRIYMRYPFIRATK